MAGMNFNVGGFNIGSGAAAVGSAGRGCKSGCGSVFGIIFGIILVPLGLYLTYHGEIKLVNHGKVFDGIEMMQPDAAKSMDGQLVKISGQPEGQFISLPEWDGQALYFRDATEEYEQETDSEGETTEEWNTKQSRSEWTDFTVGSVEVRPGENTNPVGEEEVYSAYKKKFETAFHVGTSSSNPQVGDQRRTIDVLDASKSVVVLGEMSGGSIQGGSSFVVSTLNEGATSQALHTEYKIAYWAMKGGAVMAIFVGILLIFGPLTWLVGHVPFVGDSLSCGFAAIAFVVALVSVGVITIFIKAFWILIILAVLLIAFVVIRGITTPRGGPGAGRATPPPGTPPVQPAQPTPQPSVPTPQAPRPSDAAPAATVPPAQPAPPEAAEAPKFCANCGKPLEAGAKFCKECGHPVPGA